MRLIDADSLKAQLIYFANHMQDNGHSTYAAALGEAISIVDRRQTIDAVPVVRCKDCWKRGGYHCPMFYEEMTCCDDDGYDWADHDNTEDDGFCHCGERMDGEPDDDSGQ